MSSCGTSASRNLKKGLLGLEIANLQNTHDLLWPANTSLHKSALVCRKREIFRALKVIEVRQAIQGQSLGFGHNGEVFVVYVARRKNGIASVHPLRGPELRALRRLQRDHANA
jgi:hypothetical protein